MESTGRSFFLLVIALLCSGHLVLGSHFRGGTISWEYIGGNKVRFDYLVGWRRDSSHGGSCKDKTVTSQKLVKGPGSWNCIQGCNSQVALNYRCIGYNKRSKWMVGTASFEMHIHSVGTSVVEYDDCCYINSYVMKKNYNSKRSKKYDWTLRTTIDIGTRQDTGKPNSSPVTSSKPLIKVKSGCKTSIPLAVSDADGDDVHCRLAVGQECNEVCGIVPYGTLDETKCILHFNPPPKMKDLFVLALTLEDFATVNGQMTGPFSSIPLQVIIEFEKKAKCESPMFVGRTPTNNKKFSINSGQSFSFDIDIESSSSSESIVSLSTIVSEPTTQQNITTNTSSLRLFHTGLTVTPQAESSGQKQICFFATESSGQETELRCIILTINSMCVATAFKFSPKDFSRSITWTFSFSLPVVRANAGAYVRFHDYKMGTEVLSVDAGTGQIDSNGRLTITTSPSEFSGRTYYVTLDAGVASTAEGFLSLTWPYSKWIFLVPKHLHATCTGSGDPHYSTFDGKHFSYMGTCPLLLAAPCASSTLNWSVQVQNDHRTGKKSISWTRDVHIDVDYIRVSFLKGYGVQLNGSNIRLPYEHPDGRFEIYQTSKLLILRTLSLFSVSYDGWSRVKVELESNFEYSGKMCGLCGQFNGVEADDFAMPNGQQATDAITFGKSWKVEGNSSCGDPSGQVNPTMSPTDEATAKSARNCGVMKDKAGPLKECIGPIDPENYFDDCVFDYVLSGFNKEDLCKSVEAFMTDCQEAGVNVTTNWRNYISCPLECPSGSHYELCTSPCPLTCYNDKANTNCVDECAEGCECDASDHVWEGVKCVPKQECGCKDADGRYYELGETFFKEGCEEKCECRRETPKMHCTEKKFNSHLFSCEARELGGYDCVPRTLECAAWGDPHYINFDSRKFTFMGTRTYVFTRPCKDPQWQVLVKNEHRRRVNRVSYTSELTVDAFGMRVQFLKGRKLRVNGIKTAVPYFFTNNSDFLAVQRWGSSLYVRTSFGLGAAYDGNHVARVRLLASYTGNVCGLCGNMDANAYNDYKLPNGTETTSTSEFGNSWRVVEENDGGQDDDGSLPTPDPTIEDNARGPEACGMMAIPGGPFAGCHGALPPDDLVDACAFDVATYGGADDVLCDALSAYEEMCLSQGLSIASWRGTGFCPHTCPENSVFKSCTSPCQASCGPTLSSVACQEHCLPGCDCNTGFVWNGDTCVPSSSCGCTRGSQYYQVGDSFLSENCGQRCECNSNGMITCSAVPCDLYYNECKPDDNAMLACLPKQMECGAWGDPHFRMWDGRNFNFQGTHTYVMTQPCNNGTWRVLLTNENRYNNHRVSYAKEVTMEVYGHTVSLVKSCKFMWDGNMVNIPFSWSNGSHRISVKQWGTYHHAETDFGLEMMFNRHQQVRIRLPSTYKDTICGLCGDMDKNRRNDFERPDGSSTKDPVDFGNSWKVEDEQGGNDDGGATIPDPDDVEEAEKGDNCGKMLDTTGPFEQCISKMDPEPMVKDCAFDMAMRNMSREALCDSLTVYHDACVADGVKMPRWRKDDFCPIQCPSFSSYSNCVPTVPPSCINKQPAAGPSSSLCLEGCVCDCGYVLDGEDCVPVESCGCTYQNHYYMLGESFLQNSCNMWCECTLAGVQCKNYTCAQGTVCKTIGGISKCRNLRECKPMKYSYSPKDFNGDMIIWSITFNNNLRPNSMSGFIRFWETRSSRFITKVAASSTDIQGDLVTLAFSLPRRALPSGQQVHITVDDSVVESMSGLTCKGYNFTDEPFIIPRAAYAECHASGDPHFKNFQNFHFTSMGIGTRLLAAHCPTGQPRTWEVFIHIDREPNPFVSSTTRADIIVYGKNISFIHGKGTEVDGVFVQLPYYDPSGDFHILYENFPVSVLHTKSYFTVKYNGWRRLQVELESEELYSGEMCGLCGSYDGTEGGNTRLPDGSVAPDLNTFFQAWDPSPFLIL
uniref:IgGFc-binding protein-like n=1 Tax=Myxine glutinosa TaxID=7769 RepID=UPI00358FE499